MRLRSSGADMAEPEPLEIELPANAGPAETEALVAELREALPGRPLHLNAANVETMSGIYVLALMSALETNADLSPPVVVTGAGAGFVDAFTDLGFFKDMMRMEFAA